MASRTSNNWTTIITEPMPSINKRSAVETIISDTELNTRYLKFIGYPKTDCNITLDRCHVGLEEFKIFTMGVLGLAAKQDI